MNGAGDDDFFCGGVDVAAAKQTIRQALRGQRGLAPMHEDYDGDDDSLGSASNTAPQLVCGVVDKSPAYSIRGQSRDPSVGAHVKRDKAATPKKITADYGSDDARLIELKEQGYPNDFIAAKLEAEGRAQYKPGVIAKRYLKLRKVVEKRNDEQLDDELTDWHEGEDDILVDTVKSLEEKYELEIQKVMEKKWAEVSSLLARGMAQKKYTGKACKERWEGLHDGTALLPIELDPDQEGRRVLRETRIAEARLRRAETGGEGERKKEALEAKKRADQELKDQKLWAIEEVKREREAERAEDRRLVEERKRAKEEKKAAEKEAAALWVGQIREKRKIRELEERVYRSIMGKSLRRFRNGALYADNGADLNNKHGGPEADSDEENDTDTDKDSENEPAGVHSDRDEDRFPGSGSDGEGTIPKKIKAKVTKETLANPRSILTEAELEVLLFERGLPRRGGRETHPQMVARLAAADAGLSSDDLSKLLLKFFDKGKGSKVAKALRLQKYEAEASAAGQKGLEGDDPDS